MEMSDRIFVALLSTLFLAVLVIERMGRGTAPQHVLPPPPGIWRLRDTNIPMHRDGVNVVNDVAYTYDANAAISGDEQDGAS